MSTFLVMAGGTGGHIFPALAVAADLRAKGHEVVWLGSEDSMEARVVPKYDIPLFLLKIKGVRGNGLWRKLSLPWVLLRSIQAALKIIKNQQVDALIGFGGFVSFPGGVAGKLLGKPLIIHEQNAIAGLSNKLLAKIARSVLYAFPNVFPHAEGLVGNPVREDIATLPEPSERFAQHQGALNVLVLGGSLGATVFNEKLPEIMAALPENSRPNIVHQCGKDKAKLCSEHYQKLAVSAHCVEFIDDMASAYAQADLMICRAGALTIAELTAAGLGGILVPFPFAVDDHQTHNAAYLVNGDAGICLQQDDFNQKNMVDILSHLTRERCLQWAQNARQLALVQAAQKVADTAISYLKSPEKGSL